MAIFQSLVFEVKYADECLHHIGVHFSRNVLIPFIIVILPEHVDTGIPISLLLLFLIIFVAFYDRRGLASLLCGEGVEEERLSDCSLVEVGVADEVRPRDVHLSLLCSHLFEEDLNGCQEFQDNVSDELKFLVIFALLVLVDLGGQGAKDVLNL